MNTIERHQSQSYQNVMESLVTAEVERQLRNYPPKLVKYLNQIEVETFALNRLPAFYASCTEGWHKQRKRAETEFKEEITKVVRQAFAAVQRDPIRFSTPIIIKTEQETQEIRSALEILQKVFQPDEPSWHGLAVVAKQVLGRTSISGVNRKANTSQKLKNGERLYPQLNIEDAPKHQDRWTEYHQAYRY